MATHVYQVTAEKDSGELFSAIKDATGIAPTDVTYQTFVVSVSGEYTDEQFNGVIASIVGE